MLLLLMQVCSSGSSAFRRSSITLENKRTMNRDLTSLLLRFISLLFSHMMDSIFFFTWYTINKVVLCSALFAFLALLTLTNTCFPIQVEYWISIRFTFFDAFQYVVRLLGTSLCTYFTDVFTHECSILVVFFSSTCHSQQSIANIGFMREATI